MTMARIELDKQTRDVLSLRLRRHLKDELDVEIDPVDSVALLDFLAETLGPHFYNQGLHDAQAIVRARLEDIVDAVYEIEKIVK